MSKINMNVLPCADDAHKTFFHTAILMMESDASESTILFAYLLSACPETRARFRELWDGYRRDPSSDYWVEVMEDFKWKLDARRCIALAADLCGDGGFCSELSPAYLYATPLAPVLLAAVEYWFYHRKSVLDN